MIFIKGKISFEIMHLGNIVPTYPQNLPQQMWVSLVAAKSSFTAKPHIYGMCAAFFFAIVEAFPPALHEAEILPALRKHCGLFIA